MVEPGIQVYSLSTASPGPLEVFVSYAHEDEAMRVELEQHLAPLTRTGSLSLWHDRRILPGQKFSAEIDAKLNESGLVLLLVSSAFMDSDYCWGIEMQRALELDQAGRAAVVPVILRPCLWSGAPFAELLALPSDGQPVTNWTNRDEAWVSVATGIQRLLDRRRPSAVVTGKEAYSPSALVALRVNSLLASGLPPDQLFLVAPDHAFLGETFAISIVATSSDGRPFLDRNLLLEVLDGEMTVQVEGKDSPGPTFGLIQTAQGGTNAMVVVRSSSAVLTVRVSADGLPPATASIRLGDR